MGNLKNHSFTWKFGLLVVDDCWWNEAFTKALRSNDNKSVFFGWFLNEQINPIKCLFLLDELVVWCLNQVKIIIICTTPSMWKNCQMFWKIVKEKGFPCNIIIKFFSSKHISMFSPLLLLDVPFSIFYFRVQPFAFNKIVDCNILNASIATDKITMSRPNKRVTCIRITSAIELLLEIRLKLRPEFEYFMATSNENAIPTPEI